MKEDKMLEIMLENQATTITILKEAQKLQEGLNKAYEAIKDLNVKVEANTEAIEVLNAKVEANTEAIAENTKNIAENTKEIAKLNGRVDKLEGTVNQMRKETKQDLLTLKQYSDVVAKRVENVERYRAV